VASPPGKGRISYELKHFKHQEKEVKEEAILTPVIDIKRSWESSEQEEQASFHSYGCSLEADNRRIINPGSIQSLKRGSDDGGIFSPRWNTKKGNKSSDGEVQKE